MSRRYEVAVDLILKLTVSPTLTLICVAKPCSAALPEPETSQVLLGVPGFVFSQATGFSNGAHASAAAAGPADGTARVAATRVSTSNDRRWRVLSARTETAFPVTPAMRCGRR